MCFERSIDMICLEAQYFNLNRILLQVIALWPFQQSKLVQFQFVVILSILVTATMCQLTTFMTSKITPKFVLKVLSCAMFFVAAVLHYSLFRINIQTLKNLMKELHYECTKLTDRNEIAMIQTYGWNAHRYVFAFLILFINGVVICFGSQIPIMFPDIISFMNRSRRYYIATEYFIDQQKFFYLILIHMNTAFFIGSLSMMAMGALVFMYMQHTCGLLKIACYRIEQAMKMNIIKHISFNSGHLMFRRIIYAINIQRKAMELSELLLSEFEITYFCLIVFTVFALSINFIQILQVVTSEDDIMEIIPCLIIIIIITLYAYFANLCGQNLMDHNNEVYFAAYNIQWYMCPQQIQKLILFILQRKAKEFHLVCGKVFIASFENMAMLAKASLSYFTFVHSARER